MQIDSEKIINVIIFSSMNNMRWKKQNCVLLIANMLRSSVQFSLKKSADFDFINSYIYYRVSCDDLEVRTVMNGC